MTRRPIDGDVKRHAYAFARGGIIGLVLWLGRAEITALVARYVTGLAAAGATVGALVLLAIGNNMHIRALSLIGGWGLAVIAVAYMVAWIRRTQEEAWAAEHGRDTPTFEAARETAEQRSTEAFGKDDWLLFPPWKERERRSNRRPQFGRRD